MLPFGVIIVRMSPGRARDLDELIKDKKSEAHAAWQEYVTAANNADASRYALQQMREILSKELKDGLPPDAAALAMVDALTEVQSGMDERVRQLGLRCDAIGHELEALESKKLSGQP